MKKGAILRSARLRLIDQRHKLMLAKEREQRLRLNVATLENDLRRAETLMMSELVKECVRVDGSKLLQGIMIEIRQKLRLSHIEEITTGDYTLTLYLPRDQRIQRTFCRLMIAETKGRIEVAPMQHIVADMR